MLKNFYLLFLPELPTYFIPTSSHIILTYSCNVYCISDNNVHNTHSDYYSYCNWFPVQIFLQNLHEILLPSCTSSPAIIIVTSNYFCYCAGECSIIPELFYIASSLKLQPIILKIMSA